MAKIQVPVEAKFSTGDFQQQLDRLNQGFSRLRDQLKGLEGIKLDPINAASVVDKQKALQDLQTIMRRAQEFQAAMSGRNRQGMTNAGQGGRGFFEVDWNRAIPDPTQRLNIVRSQLNNILRGTVFGQQTGPSLDAPQPAERSRRPKRKPEPEQSAAPAPATAPAPAPANRQPGAARRPEPDRPESMAVNGPLTRLDEINRAISGLAGAMGSADGSRVSPLESGKLIDPATADRDFKEILRRGRKFADTLSADMRKRLKATDQAGKDFFTVDWNRAIPDPSQRARFVRHQLQAILSGTSISMDQILSQPDERRRNPRAVPGGILGDVASSALGAAGPAGDILSRSASRAKNAYQHASENGGNAMSAGIGGGLAGLLGGLAALGVGKLIGGAREKMDAVEQEFIGYDAMKRQMGDVGVSFELLKQQVRGAAETVRTNFGDAGKVAAEFVHTAGMNATKQDQLLGEITNSMGMARAFGLDLERSAAFFANALKFGASKNTDDNRRLALMIGDAVTRSGTVSKTDEVMQMIAGYMSNQARDALSGAGVEAYTQTLTGLMRSNQPGLDPANAASILAAADSSIRRGGAYGEASQNFQLMALSRGGKLNAMQAAILQEQGAFGTAAGAFGDDSVYAAFREKFGAKQAGRVDGRTNLEVVIDKLTKDYKGEDPDMMANALANHIGVSNTKAMALLTFGPEKLGQTQRMLAGNNISLDKVDPTAINALAAMANGGQEAVLQQAKVLRDDKRLKPEDVKRLDAALASPEKQKELAEIVAVLTAQTGQQQTEGSMLRDGISGVDRTLQRMATYLIPAAQGARDALVFMAGKGEMTEADIIRKVAEIEDKQQKAAINDRYDKQAAVVDAEFGQAVSGRTKAMQAAAAAAHEERNARRIGDPVKIEEARKRREEADAAEEAAKAREKELRQSRNAKIKKIEEERSAELAGVQNSAAERLRQAEAARKAAADDAAAESNSKAASKALSGVQAPEAKPTARRGAATNYGNRADPSLRAKLEETDRLLGLPKGTSEAQLGVESNFDGSATSRAGAMGIAQIMPETARTWSDRIGRKLDPRNEDDAVLIHRLQMQENMRATKGDLGRALRIYNGGYEYDKNGRRRAAWDSKENREYAGKVLSRREMIQGQDGAPSANAPVPATDQSGDRKPQASRSDSSPAVVQLSGVLTVVDTNGKRVGDVVVPITRVPLPNAEYA